MRLQHASKKPPSSQCRPPPAPSSCSLLEQEVWLLAGKALRSPGGGETCDPSQLESIMHVRLINFDLICTGNFLFFKSSSQGHLFPIKNGEIVMREIFPAVFIILHVFENLKFPAVKNCLPVGQNVLLSFNSEKKIEKLVNIFFALIFFYQHISVTFHTKNTSAENLMHFNMLFIPFLSA